MTDGFAYMFSVGFTLLCAGMFLMWVGKQVCKPEEWPTAFTLTVLALIGFGSVGVGVVLLFATFGELQ